METAEHEFRNSKKHCLVMKERYNETQRQLELLRETKSAHAFVERSNNIEQKLRQARIQENEEVHRHVTDRTQTEATMRVRCKSPMHVSPSQRAGSRASHTASTSPLRTRK